VTSLRFRRSGRLERSPEAVIHYITELLLYNFYESSIHVKSSCRYFQCFLPATRHCASSRHQTDEKRQTSSCHQKQKQEKGTLASYNFAPCFILLLAYSSAEMCAQEKASEGCQQDADDAVAGEKAKSGDGEKTADGEKKESDIMSGGKDEKTGSEKNDNVENDGRSETTLELSPVPKKRKPTAAVTPRKEGGGGKSTKKRPAAKAKAKMAMKAKDVKEGAKTPQKKKKNKGKCDDPKDGIRYTCLVTFSVSTTVCLLFPCFDCRMIRR